MSDIQFDEQAYGSRVPNQRKLGGVTGFVIRLGLAKNEREAVRVQLIIISICVLIMLYIWWPSGASNGAPLVAP